MLKKVLVVGGGGREHALVWKLRQSPHVGTLYVAPGNGGTGNVAENVPIAATDTSTLLDFAATHGVDLTVVGPDDPLALGIVDAFASRGLPIFGPRQAAARIESSKVFAKTLMGTANIPTAAFRTFDHFEAAREYVQSHRVPLIVKASGLALGKGAYRCRTRAEAEAALDAIMHRRVHGDAGNQVVVEDFLEGQEISLHAVCDGETYSLFPPAQDHKSAFDSDCGPNTGGMGTIVPVPWVSPTFPSRMAAGIIEPALSALRNVGTPFTGCLYPGLMVTPDGPKVLEFNARFGDPETQSYMRLLETDLLEVLEACAHGRLSEIHLTWRSVSAVCIVVASGGYPDVYQKGLPISGLCDAEAMPDVVVFHAGTRQEDGLRTAGGRVLGVTAIGDTLDSALDRAYEAVTCIHFERMHYRRDIGATALATL